MQLVNVGHRMGACDVFQGTHGRKIPLHLLKLFMFQDPVNGTNAIWSLWMANRGQVIEIGSVVQEKS